MYRIVLAALFSLTFASRLPGEENRPLKSVVGDTVSPPNEGRHAFQLSDAHFHGGVDKNPSCPAGIDICSTSGDYPSYKENAVLALTNWVKVDHQHYSDFMNPTFADLCDVGSFQPSSWVSSLAQAARVQSYIVSQENCPTRHKTCDDFKHWFGDDNQFRARVETFDGAHGFGYGEIITGAIVPTTTVAMWLKSRTHCQQIFKKYTRAGVGTYMASQTRGHVTQNFASGSKGIIDDKNRLYSGSHIMDPQKSGDVFFFVTYYGDDIPSSVSVFIDGTSHPMVPPTRKHKGTYTFSKDLDLSTCHRYHFEAEYSSGLNRLPAEGAYMTAGMGQCNMETYWTDGTTSGTDTVYCDSYSGGTCLPRQLQWADARETCSKQGARLCTVDELQGGLCCGTGCGYDGALIWSSSKTRGDDTHDATDGCPGKGKFWETVSKSDLSKADVRCCFSVAGALVDDGTSDTEITSGTGSTPTTVLLAVTGSSVLLLAVAAFIFRNK